MLSKEFEFKCKYSQPTYDIKTTLDNPNGALEFKGKYVNMQRMNIT